MVLWMSPGQHLVELHQALERHFKAGPEPSEEISSYNWLGDIWGSPWRSWTQRFLDRSSQTVATTTNGILEVMDFETPKAAYIN